MGIDRRTDSLTREQVYNWLQSRPKKVGRERHLRKMMAQDGFDPDETVDTSMLEGFPDTMTRMDMILEDLDSYV